MRFFIGIFLLSFLSSCGTLINNNNIIQITSNPDGAEVIIDNRNYGTTPVTIDFKDLYNNSYNTFHHALPNIIKNQSSYKYFIKQAGIIVFVKKDGYAVKAEKINVATNKMGMFLNVAMVPVFGAGLVGITFDALTNNDIKVKDYNDEFIKVDLVKSNKSK